MIQGWLAQARTCRKAVQRDRRASVQGSEGCVARSVHLQQLEPASSLYSVHLLVLRSWKNEGFLGPRSSSDVLPASRLGCISEELLQGKLSL